MYLSIGVNILSSTTEIQLVLYSQCTVGAPVCSDRSYVYIQITLVSLTAF